MALFAAASQLRVAQAAAADSVTSGLTVAHATAAAASITGALQAGTDRARGALQSLAGEAPLRAGLLGGQGAASTAPDVPTDGAQCQGCGAPFGMIRRRSTCGSCGRFLCAACLGSRFPSVAGPLGCLCGSVCPRCVEQNSRCGEFELCRAAMETGVSVAIALPNVATGFFSSAPVGARTLAVWLSLRSDPPELQWSTLEQRAGRPAEEGRIQVCNIFGVRDTGTALELSVKGQTQPVALEFGAPDGRDAWCRYLRLAAEVLVSEGERAANERARAEHRQRGVEARQARNEERKAKLSENLGMRFTAEAVVARSAQQPSRGK